MATLAESPQPRDVVIWECESGYSIRWGHEIASASSWDLAAVLARRFATLHGANVYVRRRDGDLTRMWPRHLDDS